VNCKISQKSDSAGFTVRCQWAKKNWYCGTWPSESDANAAAVTFKRLVKEGVPATQACWSVKQHVPPKKKKKSKRYII
jgi:hypothetical protein